ncbi:MAG TPA: HAMP domain-containing sensor histidine kinase [Herpetosiphonaceae bacterium]
MRFRSIQWRLATTYVLVAVAVVGLVGLVALALIRQQARQHEEAYLRANAGVVAERADGLLRLPGGANRLQSLAETVAFLNGGRIKVLDGGRQPVADSGQPEQLREFVVWSSSLATMAAPEWAIAPSMAVPAAGGQPAFGWGPGQVVGVIQRSDSVWGESFHLSFGGGVEAALSAPAVTLEGMGEGPAARGAALLAAELAAADEPPADAESLAVEVPIGDSAAPIGYVVASDAPRLGGAAFAASYRAFGIAAVAAVALALLISLLVSRRITAPLAALSAAARAMGDGDLAIRAPALGRDEVGGLGRQLNAMAERLQASFAELAAERDTLRRFVADASHELRTPITALKTFNELLQSYTDRDPAARAEFLAESGLQLDRLETIVHRLLDLSRLDGQLVPLALAACDGADLLDMVARRLRPVAQERGLRLDVAAPAPAPAIRGDRMWLETALSNLVDNAIKFSAPGGVVELGLAGGAGEARIWVRDGGQGIAAADLPHIFERFYRGGGVRQPGSGLGLAIVQSVAQAHGGRIAAESAPGAGSCFTLSLPAAALS